MIRTGARSFRPDIGLLLAVVALLGLLLLALFGQQFAPHEAIYFVVEHGNDPRPYDPGLVFPFGSDVLGRDMFSLVLAGGRSTLEIVLLSGIARVTAGAMLASLLSWWRPSRLAIESLAELASAIPATIVALVLVKVLVGTETTLFVFVGALLVTGWAGPYRVVRAELDRLANMPFTQGARAIGVGRWRLLWRHHVPHLVPMIALNLSQQVVASLVLVAELGVLGVAIGVTRTINIEESLSRVITGQVNVTQIPDPPEWGGLLASARTIESLWLTRWLIFVPGIAFAITASAVALVGFALARRYARRDVTEDLRGAGTAALAVAAIALVLVSSVVPERYAAARDWATAARAEVRPTGNIETAFASAGLRPVGARYAVTHENAIVVQTGPASVSVGSLKLSERSPEPFTQGSDRQRQVRAFVSGLTGGGVVDAPLVFASRGLNPEDYPAPPRPIVGPRDPHFAQLMRDYQYADDYAGINVRGKVVLLVRFLGIRGNIVHSNPANLAGYALGPEPQQSIRNAIKRGAAAVIFIDPALWIHSDFPTIATIGLGEISGGTNPYLRAAAEDLATTASGVPVVVLSDLAAKKFVEPFEIDLAPFFRYDDRGDDRYKVSLSRELGVTARVEVPLELKRASTTSYVAEVADVPSSSDRILVWSIRRTGAPYPAEDVLAALGRTLGSSRLPFVFVDFDPSLDTNAMVKSIAEVLKDRQIALVVVLDRLEGPALRFTTPNGDLIPALDLYAQKAGARYVPTLKTAGITDLSGVAPFFNIKTVLVKGSGGDGDPRADAAALIGYLAGRLGLGAEELQR